MKEIIEKEPALLDERLGGLVCFLVVVVVVLLLVLLLLVLLLLLLLFGIEEGSFVWGRGKGGF